MSGGNEGGFELARRQLDFAIKHGTVESPKSCRIRGCSTSEAGYRLVSKEPCEHRANAVNRHRDTCFMRYAGYSFCDTSGALFETVVDVFFVIDKVTQRRNSCSHGQRIAAECSRLIDRA